MTQAERVRQAQAGDVDAFCALYTAYQQKLFHYAYYKLGNVQDAEDVVQDCMLTAFEQLGMLKKPEALGRGYFPFYITVAPVRLKSRSHAATNRILRSMSTALPVTKPQRLRKSSCNRRWLCLATQTKILFCCLWLLG